MVENRPESKPVSVGAESSDEKKSLIESFNNAFYLKYNVMNIFLVVGKECKNALRRNLSGSFPTQRN